MSDSKNSYQKDYAIVQYRDEVHREQLYELYREYATWHKDAVKSSYGISFEKVIGGTIQEILDNVFPKFVSSESMPPNGVIFILEVGGKVQGLGRVSRLEEGIGELNNMYISQGFRGKGYGKKMLKLLIEKAKELGYSTLRLDTGNHSTAAQHIYRKAGFKERGYYGSNPYGRVAQNTTEDGRIYYENKKYFEMKLLPPFSESTKF